MGPHAAHELVASKPAWPPSNGLKDRDRTPVDRNSDFLTGGHTIEQGPCVIAQLARGNLCHATTVALVRHAISPLSEGLTDGDSVRPSIPRARERLAGKRSG
jgi:hypothetical protein